MDSHLHNVATAIFEMVEDSQQQQQSISVDSQRRPATSSSPNILLDHLVIARLSSSVLLHCDHSSALFKRARRDSTFCFSSFRSSPSLALQWQTVERTTPMLCFAQSNAFLDEGDGLFATHSRRNEHPTNQPRTCNDEDLDTWENLEFLYNMLTHALEHMTREECITWSNCVEEDGRAYERRRRRTREEEEEEEEEEKEAEEEEGGARERDRSDLTTAGKNVDEEDIVVVVAPSPPAAREKKKLLASLLNTLVSIIVESESNAERTAASGVLRALLDRPDLNTIQPLLRIMICSEITSIATNKNVDDQQMLSVNNLLDLLFVIVSTFPTPLHPRLHRPVLTRVMVGLHKSGSFPCVVDSMIPVVLHLLKKGGAGLTLHYLRSLVRIWPVSSPRTEISFLTEMLELLQHVDSERKLSSGGGGRGGRGGSSGSGGSGGSGLVRSSRRGIKILDECVHLIFQCVARCLQSEHFEVSLHALKIFSDHHTVLSLLKSNDRKFILPLVVDALLDNAGHWHGAVSARCRDLMEAFIAMDRSFVKSLIRAHQSFEWRKKYGGRDGDRGKSVTSSEGKSSNGSSSSSSSSSKSGRGSRGGSSSSSVGDSPKRDVESDDESVSSETYATSEYSSSSYTSSEYSNTTNDSPRIFLDDGEASPKIPPRRRQSARRKTTNRGGKEKEKEKEEETAGSNSEKTANKIKRTPTPPSTPERQKKSNRTPPLSPSFINMNILIEGEEEDEEGEVGEEEESPRLTSRSNRRHKASQRRMPTKVKAPTKWITHEGKKKRLAWASGLVDGSNIITHMSSTKKESRVLARATMRRTQNTDPTSGEKK